MNISIGNLGGSQNASVSALISQLVSKRTQSLNTLLDQKASIENSLAALKGSGLGVGSINSSYSSQIASLQDTIDRMNEQYSLNANKITTVNSLKKSYASTVTSLDKYLESLKNPNSANKDPDIYLDGDKVSSNNKVNVTVNDKNTNVQEITLDVQQIATTSVLKSNVLTGGNITKDTKVTDLFAGIYDAASNSIKTNRQDLKESLKLSDLGITSGKFNLGSAVIQIDADNDTVGLLIQKIKAAGYNASIEVSEYDSNGEGVGRLVISGSAGQSIAITSQTSNFGSVMGLTVTEGNFYINGAEFTITSTTTLGSLMSAINSASADNVGAKLEDGKLVFVASETGAVDINVEKGTSNFTNAVGFTVGGVMDTTNLVLGSDGSYVTLTGKNNVSASDTAGSANKFTEGNFTVSFNKIDSNGTVLDEMQTVTIEITNGMTIEDIAKQIEDKTKGSYVDANGKTVQTGLTAYVDGTGKFTIRQTQKGAEYNISVEAGTSNFTNYVGMTSSVSNTTSKDADNSYLIGTTKVPDSGFTAGSFTITTNKLSDDGKTASFDTVTATIDVTTSDTKESIAQKINDANIGLTASITADGYFKIEQNNSGADFDIKIQSGATNFTEKAGLTSNVINTGVLSPGSSVNQYTSLTGTTNVTANTAIKGGSFLINGVTIKFSDGTISSAIDEINAKSDLTGVNAYLKDGKVVLQANKTGPDYSIYIEGGTSDFATVAGFITQAQSAATATVGVTGERTTLTGAYDVSADDKINAGTIKINGIDIELKEGTLAQAVNKINEYSTQTGVTAAISNGKLVFTNIDKGDKAISIEAGTSNFAAVTGTAAYQTTIGNIELIGGSKTTLTGSVEGVSINAPITESVIKINGQDITVSGTINSAINSINANSGFTGVTASLDDLGRLVFTNTKTGDKAITLSSVSGDFVSQYVGTPTQVLGTASKAQVTGSNQLEADSSGIEYVTTVKSNYYIYNYTSAEKFTSGSITIKGQTFDAAGKTLQQIVSEINSSGIGITAELVSGTDSSGRAYKTMQLVGKGSTELDSKFSVTSTGDFARVVGFGAYSSATASTSIVQTSPATSSTDPSTPTVSYAHLSKESAIAAGYTVIETVEDLKNLIFSSGDLTSGKKYMLVNDIDLSGVTWSWTNVSTPVGQMQGIFDGNGYTISNLNSNGGLFNGISSTGSVQNLVVKNADYCGSLLGVNSGTVSNVHVVNSNVGGADANVSGSTFTFAAGLVFNNTGTIEQSSFDGTISGAERAAGLAYMTGGGGTIENSYVKGSITGSLAAAGLAYSMIGGVISESYVSATFSDTLGRGALVRTASGGTIRNSFWDASKTNITGPVGTQSTSFTYENVEGLTASEMATEHTFTNVGWSTSIWDFSGPTPTFKLYQAHINGGTGGEGGTGPTTVTATTQALGAYANGNATFIKPVTEKTTVPAGYTAITTEDELLTLLSYNPTGKFILMDDIIIDMGGLDAPSEPLISSFEGVLDGNGHKITISNLNYELSNVSTSTFALFDNLSGDVSNLAVNVANVGFTYTGTSKPVTEITISAIALSNYGTLDNVVGRVYLRNSSPDASYMVNCGVRLAGIAALNYGTISSSRGMVVNSSTYQGAIIDVSAIANNGKGEITNTAGFIQFSHQNDIIVGSALNNPTYGFVGCHYSGTVSEDENYMVNNTPSRADLDANRVAWGNSIYNITYEVETSDQTSTSVANGPTTTTTTATTKGLLSSPMLSEAEAIVAGYTVIKTAAELKNITNNPSGKYILMSDIDLSGTSWTPLVLSGGEFNGNGFIIKNLTCTTSSRAGLFGVITNSTVRNVGLENVNIRATGSGNETGQGGIAGKAENSTIENCYVTGSIAGDASVGGLVGRMKGGTITGSFADVSLSFYGSDTKSAAGGLVGTLSGNFTVHIENSYAIGSISGFKYGAGLVGKIQPNNDVDVSYSYAAMSYSNVTSSAGLIASIEGGGGFSVSDSTWDSELSGATTLSLSDSVGVITNSSASTTSQMADSSRFINNFGFSESIWDFSDSKPMLKWQAKRLIPTTPTTRLTEEEAIAQGYTIIKTAADLANISNNMSGKYILMNDIDMSGVDWTPIGSDSNPFTGELRGNGFTIKNLSVTDDSALGGNVGLFAYLRGASINDLRIENANISTTAGSAGAIAGYANDTYFTNVHVVNSNISGSGAYFGGIVGEMYQSGIYMSSVDEGTTVGGSAVDKAGGLVGYANFSNISTTYSKANVSAGDAGGIAGATVNARIDYSYFDGTLQGYGYTPGGIIGYSDSMSSIVSSYWNASAAANAVGSHNSSVESSVLYYSYAKTSEELKDPSTYSTWDRSPYWNISSGSTPTLRSETEILYTSTATPSGPTINAERLTGGTTITDQMLNEGYISQDADESQTVVINYNRNGTQQSISFVVQNGASLSSVIDQINSTTPQFRAEIVDGKLAITATTEDVSGIEVTSTGDFATFYGLSKTSHSWNWSESQGGMTIETTQQIVQGGSDSANNIYSNGGLVTGSVDLDNMPSSSFTNNGHVSISLKITEQQAIAAGYTVIKSVSDLMKIDNDLGGKYILMNDIDLSGVDWTPLANSSSNAFYGILNGNGYTIKGLNSTYSTAASGLFGYVSSAQFLNLKLTDVNLSGGTIIGALAGCASGGVTVENVYVEGSIFAGTSAGGLFAMTSGQTFIMDTNTNVSVRALNPVTSDVSAGGFIGIAGSSVVISRSISAGTIHAQIANSSSGTASNAGGFIGQFASSNAINISNSVFRGSLISLTSSSGNNYAGIMIGSSMFSTASVTLNNVCGINTNSSVTGSDYIGTSANITLEGYNPTSLSLYDTLTDLKNNGWDVDKWAVTTSAQGLISVDFEQSMTFWPLGELTINGVALNYSGAVLDTINSFTDKTGVVASISNGKLVLENKDGSDKNIVLGGRPAEILYPEGMIASATTKLTEEEAIAQGYTVIKTAQDLQNINNNLSGKYILMADIDLGSIANWVSLATDVSNPFKGELNGNGYTIKNLNITSGSDYTGLFAYADGAKFTNIRIEDANINFENNTGENFGILAGSAVNSTIEYVSVSGTANAQSNTGAFLGGGIVGFSQDNTYNYVASQVDFTIIDSNENTANVIGAIAGMSISDKISNAYAGGSINSATYGMYAGIAAALQESYISNSFVETEISCDSDEGSLIGSLSAYYTDMNSSGNKVISSTSYTTPQEGIVATLTQEERDQQAQNLGGWDLRSGTALLPGSASLISNGTIVINNQTIHIDGGVIEQVIEQINAQSSVTGVVASINSENKLIFQNANASNANITISSGTSDLVEKTGTATTLTQGGGGTGDTPTILQGNSEVSAGDFVGEVTLKYGKEGSEYTVTTSSTATLNDLINAINNNTSSSGIYAEIVNGKFTLSRVSGSTDPIYSDISIESSTGLFGAVTGLTSSTGAGLKGTVTGSTQFVMPTDVILTEADAIAQGYTVIKTAADLKNINNNLSGKYILMADITLSSAMTAIGTSSKAFTGEFNGNGHTISGLKNSSTTSSYQGLFGYVSGATIKNVTLSSANVQGSSHVGALVGYADNTTIENVFINGGTVKASSQKAALVVGSAMNNTTINNAFVTGGVSAKATAGGIAADLQHSSIKNSFSAAYVTASGSVGGIVGYSYYGTLDQVCHRNGTITANYVSGTINSIGGILGAADMGTKISNAYAYSSYLKASSSGTNRIGGIAGFAKGATITYSVEKTVLASSSGSITYKGGIIGYNDSASSTVKDSYYRSSIYSGVAGYGPLTTSDVTGLTSTQANNASNYGNLSTSYWTKSGTTLELKNAGKKELDSDIKYQNGTVVNVTSGTIYINGTSVTLSSGTLIDAIDKINTYTSSTGVTAELKNGRVIFKYADGSEKPLTISGGTSNFVDITGTSTASQIQATDAGKAGSSGQSIDTYYTKRLTEEEAIAAGYTVLKTAADLQNIKNNLSGHYILVGDIDLQGVDWTPIGESSAAFTGELNGNGYTISNLNIESVTSGAHGLFGYTDGAAIKNLFLHNANVQAANGTAGVLVGSAEKTIIQNVHVSSSKVKGKTAGLLAALITDGTTISQSSVSGYVDGTCKGGIVGMIASSKLGGISKIEDSLASVKFSSSNMSGGIVGIATSESGYENEINNVIFVDNDSEGLTYGVGFNLTHTKITNAHWVSDTTMDASSALSAAVSKTNATQKTASQLQNASSMTGFDSDIWTFSSTGPSLNAAIFNKNTYTLEADYTKINGTQGVTTADEASHISREEAIKQGYTIIDTAEDLEHLLANTPGTTGKYILMGDIDMSGINWPPVGTNGSGFNGIFEGNGYTISNLNGSLFSAIRDDSIVRNLYLSDSTIINQPGILAQYNYGHVINVHAQNAYIINNTSDTITGGGLVFDNSGLIDQSSFNGSINSTGTAGGLAAINSGIIRNSYVKSDIDSGNKAGGLVVENLSSGIIENSYVSASISLKNDGELGAIAALNSGTIKNTFWDTSKTNITEATGNLSAPSAVTNTIGLSASQMGSSSVFTSAGWDTSIWDFSGKTPALKASGIASDPKDPTIEGNVIQAEYEGTFTISSTSGESVTINVTAGMTVQDILDAINADGDYKAEINEDGKIVITSVNGGVTDMTFSGTSNLEDYFGLVSSKVETGNPSYSVSLGREDEFSTLTGQNNVNSNMTFSAGDFSITVDGKTVTFDILEGESLNSVLNKINSSDVGVIASIQNGKVVLTSKNPGAVDISLKDGTSNFAEITGFVGSGGVQLSGVVKGVLSTYTSANTAQSAQNSGISAGDFFVHLTDTNGNITNTVRIEVSKNESISSIIDKINNSGLGVTASINDSGKMVITRNSSETAGGVLVTQGSSDFTNKIGFTSGGYQSAVTQYGQSTSIVSTNAVSTAQRFTNGNFIIGVEDQGVYKEYEINVSSTDSILDVIDKINKADIGVTASFNSNNKLVLTKDSDTGEGSVTVKKGSSDFTTVLGFSSGGIFNGSLDDGEAPTHTVLVSNKLAVSGKATMASLGINSGSFRINGVEIAIKETDTIEDVVGRINSIFNNAKYADIGVTAEYKNNQIILTSKKASSDARIDIESGSTNFTEVVGFTDTSSRNNVVEKGQNAEFSIQIGDGPAKDYNVALDLNDITNDNIYNGNNLIYLDRNGKVVSSANNAAITIEIKQTGETVIKIGQNLLDASINELNKFVGNFNKAMIMSENEILSDDAEFATLINNIKTALTDDVADIRKIQQELAEIGITVDIRGGENSNMGTVRIYLDKQKYTEAFYADSQHVLDLLVGKETAIGVEDGVFTRLNNVLFPEVNNKNGYFNKVPRQLEAIQKQLKREITSTTFDLNELKLAVSGTPATDGLSEYLAQLEEQYRYINEAIDNLNKQYASSVTRLILNQNNAGFNPII